MEGISKTNGTQSTNQAPKPTSSLKNDSKFEAKYNDLNSRIIDPPQNIEDLKNNASIKRQLIQLAQQQRNTELVNTLQKELNRINADIQRNETSIFDK